MIPSTPSGTYSTYAVLWSIIGLTSRGLRSSHVSPWCSSVRIFSHVVRISPNRASTWVFPESREQSWHISSMCDTTYLWRVRRTRLRWAKVVSFHDCWEFLARKHISFTCLAERFGTSPSLFKCDGLKHCSRVGLAGSTSLHELGSEEDPFCGPPAPSLARGRFTKYEMSGTRSNNPSTVSQRSLKRFHFLLSRYAAALPETTAMANKTATRRVSSGVAGPCSAVDDEASRKASSARNA
mmetsp:Transcript_14505/g.33340  ORF Transcript_14505/g.33340 Transcript_14505/m.33340 type:complete len:239 (+) Transcript_14505:1275-1991(+)